MSTFLVSGTRAGQLVEQKNLPSFNGVFQADGGVKKGRAAFGDLTNQSQGQARGTSVQVQYFDATKILLATDCQLQQQTLKACLCHGV